MKHSASFPRILLWGQDSEAAFRLARACAIAGFSGAEMVSALTSESLEALLEMPGADLVVVPDEGAAGTGLVDRYPQTGFLVLGSNASTGDGKGPHCIARVPEPEADEDALVSPLVSLLNEVWLRQRADLFHACLEASGNGVILVDACSDDMPIVYVNPAFSRLTGYSLNEVYGRNCRFLQGGDRKQPGVDQLRMALRTGASTTVQLRNYRRDGSWFWNELQVSPIHSASQQITHYVGVMNDVSARMEAESVLAYRTGHDGLTGLPNFEKFRSRLTEACNESRHHRHSVALTLLNLDNFKAINATYGMGSGDELLKAVVTRISPLLGRNDLMARLSADEFAVMQIEVLGQDDVTSLIDSVVSVLSIPFRIDGQELFITASAGIALLGEDTQVAEDLVSHASMALRKAKQKDGAGYLWYSSALAGELERTMRLQSQLQQALNNEQFELWYQPVFEIRSQEMVGVEALLRWHHPELGLLTPGDFLQAVESGGFMVEITDWVLRRACTDLRCLSEWSGNQLWVSVNISPNHFLTGNVVSAVSDALEKTGLPPACLNLELVESAFLSFEEPVRKALEDLRVLGVGLMIDDFGAGFSSLTYLKQVPATSVKIDRSFICDVISSSADAAITRGVIALAHKLNLKVVGEGVEDRYQLGFLARNHCDLVQGFLPGAPMPFSALKTFEPEPEMQEAMAELRSEVPEGQQLRRLLVLDDEPNILRALKRLLRRDGYELHTATTAQEALEILATKEFQVVLSDQRMPEMTGTDFLSRVKELYPDTIRIVLSGYTDLESVTDAINRGAIYKFLTKPWDDEQLRNQIREAFLHHDAAREEGDG